MAIGSRFAGLTAVVTGSGSGIGRASAARIAAEGGAVACLDIDERAAGETAAAIAADGGAAHPVHCDVADEDSVAAAFAAVAERWPERLDVLVANAGIAGPRGQVPELERSDWERLVGVNLTGQLLCAKQALARFLAGDGGSIVFTASHLSLAASPSWTAYGATKAGVLGLARGLAIDHAPHRVRVNCVCPGPIDTPLAREEFADLPADEVDAAVASFGRVGSPEELAAVVAFLASPEASLVTGAAVVADGAAAAHIGTSWPNAAYFSS